MLKKNNLLFVRALEDHTKIKDKLLKLIEQCPSKSDGDNTGYHVSRTDYYNELPEKPDYWKFVNPYFEDHILKLFINKKIHSKGFKIVNFWFQQYFKNDLHDWHIHGNNHLANVYFLEMPSKEVKTEVKNLFGEKIEYEAKEGDVITFPCFYYHKSPINITQQRKTIIAYNVDLLT